MKSVMDRLEERLEILRLENRELDRRLRNTAGLVRQALENETDMARPNKKTIYHLTEALKTLVPISEKNDTDLHDPENYEQLIGQGKKIVKSWRPASE